MNEKKNNITEQDIINSVISNILQDKSKSTDNVNKFTSPQENVIISGNRITTKPDDNYTSFIKNRQITAKNEDSYNEFVATRRLTTNERDKLFNYFLDAYTESFEDKSSQKIKLKKYFFILIMIIFFIIILMPVFVIIFFSQQNHLANFIVTIVGSFIELFTAFLVLPKIIAEYLFNKEEDNNMVTIIEKMQMYNLENIKEEYTNK